MEDVDAMLDEVPLSRKNQLLDEDLGSAVAYFLERKREKDPRAHVSFCWFYTNKLQPRYGGPGLNLAYRYVRDVLGLDVKTGRPL